MASNEQPIQPPSWTIPNWYLDPANATGCASNANSCTSATCTGPGIGPCLLAAEVVSHRWGTQSPILPQTTTFNLLSSETVGQESVVLTPTMVAASNFVILGTPAAQHASFTVGTVTAMAPGHPGVLLQGAGFTHGETAGMIVQNVTRGSFAFIDSVTGPGVATLTRPFTTASYTTITPYPFPAVDDGWTTGNTVQAFILPMFNLKLLRVGGGDGNVAFTAPTVWLQEVFVPDVSGTAGSGYFAPATTGGASVVVSLSRIDPFIEAASPDTALLGCWLNGGGLFRALTYLWTWIYGGAVNTSAIGDILIAEGVITSASPIMHGGPSSGGTPNLRMTGAGNHIAAYFDSHIVASVEYTSSIKITDPLFEPAPGTPVVWGSGSLSTEPPGSCVSLATADTWANSLQITALSLDGVGTGWSQQATGTFTATGSAQLTVSGVNGTNAFPANASISFALTSLNAGTPTGLPYFSAAQIANSFFVKAAAADTGIYAWTAAPAPGIALTTANLDIYNGLINPRTGSRFSNN